ncbi:hypothetical protein PG988_005962 [Apiospora saccharicola]
MATPSLHDVYTRDTAQILHWLVNTSNDVINSLEDGSSDMQVKTTGEVTATDIPEMAGLVSEHLSPSEIPHLVIWLFDTVIGDRMTVHRACVRLEKATPNPDPELVESNKTHKFFIEKLCEAFTTLDGPSRMREHRASSTARPSPEELKELARSTNRFSALSIDGASRSDNDQSSADEGSGPESASRQTPTKRKKSKGRRRKKTKGKGKKRGSRKKRQLPQEDEAAKSSHHRIPLESCRIVGDVDVAYHMAVHALARKWIELRSEVQTAWRNVVYGGLHSVVATGASHLTVAMVKQSELALATDFPGRDNYQTVLGTLTGVKPDKCLVSLRITRCSSSDGQQKVTTADIDIEEHVMLHTFRDLVDFLVDYNKYPKGRPTTHMLTEIQSWDLKYDLQQATSAQRVEWRRVYTIKWLYDLVDAVSSTDHNEHISGLKKFAATITSLTENTPAKDIGCKVMPHHLFQLQCIVDSFAVSRGWFVSSLGHMISSPRHSFDPSRDIGRFMSDKTSLFSLGRFPDMNDLKLLSGNNSAVLGCVKILEDIYHDLICKKPRSTKDTWEVSPFVCGAGLLEVLDVTYSIGLRILENTPECLMVIHLHQMLVTKGFLKKSIQVITIITRWLAPACFKHTTTRSSGFSKGFLACINNTSGLDTSTDAHSPKREAVETATEDITHALEPKAGRYFEKQSLLNLCRQADWVPDCIPDKELCPASVLYSYRVSRTEPTIDPVTGGQRLQETPLVLNAKKQGVTEEALIDKCQLFWGRKKNAQDASPNSASTDGMALGSMLALLMCDLATDVEGTRPRSNLNLVAIAGHCITIFEKIELYLRQIRHPLWIKAYEWQNPYGWSSRVALTYLVLLGQDEKGLMLVAAAFESLRRPGGDFTYWAGKKSVLKREPHGEDLGKFMDAVCPVM